MNRKWLYLLVPIILIAGVYLWKPAQPDNLYANAPADQVASLQAFQENYPPAHLIVNGRDWEYLAIGEGAETVLFLHGMTGSYDIWWQQIEALKESYRVISVTYPAANSLGEMEAGVLAILEQEGVKNFNVVGTSLGGYFTQYLVSKQPDRITSAVFSNTFPPNDIIKEKNGTIGAAIPYLPEWLVMNVLRGSFETAVYPASGNDEMTLAFLNEISYGRMRKPQVAGRYKCVVEKFDAPANTTIPLLIIEASNDPLVEEALRESLKSTYLQAKVITVDNGHFPYIATPEFYTQQLVDFWESQ
ncbi:MAG: alpha/beta hydrolase [Chloroflexi bacterium]|nr:alpha/beta hydrolase [Chloroflexota bacterium]